MIIRLGLKELKRNYIINILCFLQISLIFIVLSAMLTSVLNKYEKYKPFNELLDGKGIYIDIISLFYTENNTPYTVYDEKNLSEKLGITNIDSVCYMKKLWVNQNVNTCVLSDGFINKYKPELETGNWFSQNENLPEGVIAGVISDNSDNINVGDIFELSSVFDDEISVKVYVTGKFSDDTSVLYTAAESDNNISYEDMFMTYNHKVEEMPLLILRSKDIDLAVPEMPRQITGPMIISYNNDISQIDEDANYNRLLSNGDFKVYSSLTKMNENSLQVIYEDLFRLMPMIVSVLLLVVISVISMSAVNTKSRIKTYAVYYICGMQWKHIVFIEAVKSIIIISAAGFVSFIICCIANNRNILGGLLIGTGLWQIISWIIIGVVFTFVSTLLPTFIIKKETPVTVFRC